MLQVVHNSTVRRGRQGLVPCGGTARAVVCLALVLALIGPGGGCDNSGLQFSMPDRKFQDLQVVSAFPAVVHDGVAQRVCGAPLPGEATVIPDALELTVNLVGSGLLQPICDGDGDLSVMEGELIDLQPVVFGPGALQLRPHEFTLEATCIEPRAPNPTGKGCATAIQDAKMSAIDVRYERITRRCNPARVDTRVNLALIIDRSGSTAGWVEAGDGKEHPVGNVNLPSDLEPSDYEKARAKASSALLASLNHGHDRVIGYYFDEAVGVAVAASDQGYCDGGALENKRCLFDSDCGGGFNCEPGSGGDPTDPVDDTFTSNTLDEAEARAFGSSDKHHGYLLTALADKATHGGQGRAPLWPAVEAAYDFLRKKLTPSTAPARHILVIADGPDTCSHSEAFSYKNSAGMCRVPCLSANLGFEELLETMHGHGFPIRIHFIQFQSQAYRQPDAGMMEIACRSGGTYQFINSQEIDKHKSGLADAVLRAALKVRSTFAGSWKVSTPMAQFGPKGLIKPGRVQVLRGNLKLRNPRFRYLDWIYDDSSSWRFEVTDKLDGGLVFRVSCATHADCGGDSECGANHCSAEGMCVPGPAPDRLPCAGGAGVCCGGVCVTVGACTAGCK